jgi:hypothetical protein|tara:strand:+ start:1831 stop:2052 length:222 start_codon:yes stop_codon:yes gene_type:complete
MTSENGAIMPTTEDINAVLNSNPTAQLQLQIQMLSRTVKERDEKIAELESEINELHFKSNNKGSVDKLEKTTA